MLIPKKNLLKTFKTSYTCFGDWDDYFDFCKENDIKTDGSASNISDVLPLIKAHNQRAKFLKIEIENYLEQDPPPFSSYAPYQDQGWQTNSWWKIMFHSELYPEIPSGIITRHLHDQNWKGGTCQKYWKIKFLYDPTKTLHNSVKHSEPIPPPPKGDHFWWAKKETKR